MARTNDDSWKADVERSIIASTRAMLGDVQVDWPSAPARGRRAEELIINKSRAVGRSEKQPIGIGGKCLNCFKVWNVSQSDVRKALHCPDCNGFIVTPSGRVHSRVFWEGEEDALKKLPVLK